MKNPCCRKTVHQNETKEQERYLQDKPGSVSKNDTASQREEWPRQMDFLFACVGYAVGVGSIYRFPYICMRNGGGAFLIPYFLSFLFCGIPLFCLEVALGQFSKKGVLQVWDICPLFRGIGFSMVLLASICTSYYNIILTWNIYYLFKSFTRYYILQLSSGIDDLGGVRWELLGFYILSWVIVYVCLFKGVKSMGKVAYVTATLPYLLLSVLFVRGLLLPGSMTGIKFYLIPKWEKLLEIRVWAEACLQVFYSLGPAWGGIITMASYNRFHNNCIRDGIFVSVLNGFTNFYGGFVIFAVIGFLAQQSGQTVEEVGASGIALGFIVYPEALAKMPLSPLWAILFFTMMLTIGIDSQFGMFETMITTFIDAFPKLLKKRKSLFVAMVCVLETLIGIIFCTKAGFYIFQFLDWYIGVFSLLLISLLECVVISWIYGGDRFFCDISLMLGNRPSIWWKICWSFLTPFILLIVWIYNFVQFGVPYYYDYKYPDYTTVIGWMIALVSAVPIPYFIIKEVLLQEGTLKQIVWIYNFVQFGVPYYYDYKYPDYTTVIGWMIALVSAVPIPYFIIKEVLLQEGTLKQRFFKALQPCHSWGPGDLTVDYECRLMQKDNNLKLVDSSPEC